MIRYTSVVLFSDDVPRLRDFYREIFDLPVILDLGGLVTFEGGISIWAMDKALAMVYGGLDPSPVERPRCELYFETDAIEEFAAGLEGRARLAHPLSIAPWAQRVIRFYDPDVNLIEVGEAMDAVARRLAAEGLSPEEVAALTLMPPAFVAAALGYRQDDGGALGTDVCETCQSCGMPLSAPEDRGTEEGGAANLYYCRHCYRGGAFTEPDATIESMAARGSAMMASMYDIPTERAEEFVLRQLRPLLRWSGRLVPSCGSCGMPLQDPADAGTEADGSPSGRYCIHCYRHGAFVEPDLTRDRMVAEYAPLLAAELGMPPEKAREMVTEYTATLPRWR